MSKKKETNFLLIPGNEIIVHELLRTAEENSLIQERIDLNSNLIVCIGRSKRLQQSLVTPKTSSFFILP